ncbi:MAG: biotin--[acetyl-CoA-carboxylase] ligase [Candidatus Cloacimonetes bacterium]|nr:biotin--[acetyl-CoA-carboxylase] ligase [Candidatus Cloacimonadota bacterium]
MHALFDETIVLGKTASTQKDAEKRIREGDVQGNFLVVATEQSGGRGRGDNRWHSPQGGLWMTMALYGLSVPPSLTLFCGVCLQQAMAPLLPAEASLRLKWPNDIMLDGRKLAGILSAHLAHKRYHLLGIGVNTNVASFPQALADGATSLSIATGDVVDNDALMLRFFDIFAAELPRFIDEGFAPWVEEYRERCFLSGKRVSLQSEFAGHEGISRGINRHGALLIELEGGMIQPFYAGTVTQVREVSDNEPEQV